jgi:hypothetical protein
VSSSIEPQRRRLPLPSFLARLFAERDPIDAALADLERQGASSARVAHLFAGLLVILFSAGSLVALGSDALQAILVQWNRSHTLDIPSTITLSVSTLMVLAMDTGMLVAAATLRVLAARRAGIGERLVHIAVMAGVAIIEASTYWYMSVRFEAPATGAAQALIIARALAAPVLAVYLSMSRALPVTSRDIMSQVELASGRGLLRDVTLVANDRTAPLERKMKLYGASAVMSVSERTRLADMITAVQESGGITTPTTRVQTSESPYTRAQEGQQYTQLPAASMSRVPRLAAPGEALSESDYDPDRPPTGPGSPAAHPGVRTASVSTGRRPAVLRLEPPEEWRRETAAQATAGGAHRRGGRTGKRAKTTVEERVRKVWRPGMSIGMLERAAGISHNSAGKWRKVLIAEAQEPLQTLDMTAQQEETQREVAQ